MNKFEFFYKYPQGSVPDDVRSLVFELFEQLERSEKKRSRKPDVLLVEKLQLAALQARHLVSCGFKEDGMQVLEATLRECTKLMWEKGLW